MYVGLVFNQKSPTSKGKSKAETMRLSDAEAEWDSPETIDAIAEAIASEHDVARIEANEDAFKTLKKVRPDLVFNVAEGRHGAGRESQIPAMLEMLDIPYTGSDPVTLGICLDKSRAKEILAYHGIPTPAFLTVEDIDELNGQITPPAVVKPLWEGSSRGITNDCLTEDYDFLRHRVQETMERYRQPVLVEQYLPGREFTAALLGNGSDVRVLPLVEMDFSCLPAGANPMYSYEAKWIWDNPDDPLPLFRCPADTDEALREAVEDTAKKAFRVLRCRDWSRIDMRLDEDGVPNVLEINPLPGILPDPEDHSCFPAASRAAGISYAKMILAVVREACRRYGIA